MLRTIKSKVVLTTLLLLNLTTALAADKYYESAVMHKVSAQQFAVSAILRKNDQASTIRLVQSIEVASSKEEASGLLLSRIKREIQGYSVLETLVSPIIESKKGCDSWV